MGDSCPSLLQGWHGGSAEGWVGAWQDRGQLGRGQQCCLVGCGCSWCVGSGLIIMLEGLCCSESHLVQLVGLRPLQNCNPRVCSSGQETALIQVSPYSWGRAAADHTVGICKVPELLF